MTKLDVAHPSLEVAGLSLAGACAAIGLTTMFCSALLVLALAPFTVLLGMGLGLCPPVALAALSGRHLFPDGHPYRSRCPASSARRTGDSSGKPVTRLDMGRNTIARVASPVRLPLIALCLSTVAAGAW